MLPIEMKKPLYLDIDMKCMNEVWYDYIKTKHGDKQNYVTLILTALLFILWLKILTKTLLMMLRDDLIHLTMMRMMIDSFQ